MPHSQTAVTKSVKRWQQQDISKALHLHTCGVASTTRLRCAHPKVALDDCSAPHLQLSKCLAIPRQLAARLVHDAHVYQHMSPALHWSVALTSSMLPDVSREATSDVECVAGLIVVRSSRQSHQAKSLLVKANTPKLEGSSTCLAWMAMRCALFNGPKVPCTPTWLRTLLKDFRSTPREAHVREAY